MNFWFLLLLCLVGSVALGSILYDCYSWLVKKMEDEMTIERMTEWINEDEENKKKRKEVIK